MVAMHHACHLLEFEGALCTDSHRPEEDIPLEKELDMACSPLDSEEVLLASRQATVRHFRFC